MREGILVCRRHTRAQLVTRRLQGSTRTWLRTRLPTLCALMTVVLLLLLGVHLRGSAAGAWRMLGVAALSPSFADTLTVTQSIDCVRAGVDPYETKECDPFHRLYNYPPIWLSLRYAGVSSRSTSILAGAMAGMTFAALLVLFRSERRLTGILIFFGVLSPPVLLAVERGNIDQVVFSVLVVGIFWIEGRLRRGRPAAMGLLVVLLTILKVYPIAAVAVFARRRRWVMTGIATWVAAVTGVLLTAGARLREISANTPQDTRDSFGSLPAFYLLAQRFWPGSVPLLLDHHVVAGGLAILVAVASVVTGWVMRERLGRFLPRLDIAGPRASIAVSGLGIFCFAFARGSNFTYRLMFLLGALALLIDDLNESGTNRSLPVCLLILCFLWVPVRSSPVVFQVLDVAMFAVACAWLGRMVLATGGPSLARVEGE